MNITVIYKTISPISHIDRSVSNYSSFNQIKLFDDNDELIEIPIISANSFRGALRNAGASYILTLLNTKVSKPVFHLLFSGGSISSSIVNDVDKANSIREQHPFVSIFGGCTSDMMLSGKIQLTNLYPIVKETKNITKIESNKSYKHLLSDYISIKMDDSKNDLLSQYMNNEYSEDVKTQMIYETEYLTVGTSLWQEIILKDMNELELGAFISSIWNWLKNNAVLGGKANAGFGFFEAIFDFGEYGKIIYENRETRIAEHLEIIMNSYTNYLLSNKENQNYFDILENKNKSARKK
ncbi:RAMP superfamily CRISPR-associated protein [Brachyspira sp. G79]|uniref:RAMP superfamily CRISPR-associated protein n=1 Tax=Brachyspira sp. G79 TaxID=1358104 RepID=UPI000BBC4DEE|nr:RAMP superfamily CRISPR-associated protein [Brachyspira sp. G79]PCG20838.1 hypothetical protein KQ44_13260 [Brachyspira sp. G79]